MAITISGANNVDKILATDGVLDSISGFNVVGVMTAGTFDVTGKTTTGHLNIGSNIQLGNAGIITATTLVGNVTGNINATSNLLLQIGGSEKFRVASSGQLGIGGANYGSSGQVLTSGGSGSAATWSTIASDKITEGNTEAEVVDTGSDGHFKVTTEGSERLRIDSSGRVMIGTTTEGQSNADELTIAGNSKSGMTFRAGTNSSSAIYFSDGTSGAAEYEGFLEYHHSNNSLRFGANHDSWLEINSSGNVTPFQDSTNDLGENTKRWRNLYADTLYGDGSNLTSLPAQATIANNADNRVITGGSGVNLNGEANFTYNSDVATLTRSGNDNASGLVIANSNNSQASAIAQVKIQGGDNASGRLMLECNGQDHTLIEDSVGNLSFADNGTERLRITPTGAFYIKSPNGSTGDQPGEIQWWNENGAGVMAKIGVYREGTNYAPSGIKFYTTQNVDTAANNSQGDITERFFINSEGKFYKGGNQIYPLVNYVEVASFSAASVSSNSYTDLRTIYSSYSPKKAGNRIVMHHQSQLWQGGNADGNGDAMWRIQKNEGSGWSTVIANERIIGNMDGRNYTGGSGLARHHRTVHLMGSFISNGNNFDLKTQGKVDHTNVSLQWYHNAENILQIWEYELG